MLPRRLLSRSEDEPCPKTTSASTAATAGRRRSLWRPARPSVRWRKEPVASGEDKLPTLPGQIGRRRRLPRDRRPRSGSSSIAGEHLTTPCSPPLHLLLLLLPPPLSPPTFLQQKRPDSDPTVSLRRGRTCPRAAHAAAAPKPKNTRFPAPRPIRINRTGRNTNYPMFRPIRTRLSFRKCPLLLLRPVPCSPGGRSDR